MSNIVCYTGGTCGDLVCAILDPTNAAVIGSQVRLSPDRSKFKKPHLWDCSESKDQYLKDISILYKSIPSHDLDYHVERKHEFIAVTIHTHTAAVWAAQRFKDLHKPHVWDEMGQRCGASTVDEYAEILLHYSRMVTGYTENRIPLESILSGNLIACAKKYANISATAKQLYQQWLIANQLYNLR